MQKVIDYVKQYIVLISIVLAVCILLTYSLSYFMTNSDNHRAAEMYIGELKYTISIDGTSTNTLTVPAGETIVDIDLTNQNEIKTYYKLLYLNNANISISYFNQTKNTSEEVTNYKSPSDVVESKSQNSLKLKIMNNSSSNQTLTFKVSGGYSTNTLADVEVPNTYTEITSLETPSTNTYFCKTNETLTQGIEYVDGQYTYGYKKEGASSSSGIAWNNISRNGWGVQLTDKTSTVPVTSRVCTYINNKPVVSMSCMFYDSQATTLDLSNFNTSNVTDMYGMFLDSQATTLDLSNFDTSNVTDMRNMFSLSQATTLDVSNFDTSKVIEMNNMFSYSEATTIDVSNFNTSNVTNMASMFNNSQATTLDVSNFDTSKVTNMRLMFFNSKATALDVSNFNTSNVTNMDSMFSDSKATALDVSNFNTSNVTDMNGMFENTVATTLDVSGFNTSKVTDMSWMFQDSKATTIDVSNFNTSNVTDMSYMFYNSKATTLDLSSFDTSNVTNMSYMFGGSLNLTTIYVSNKFLIDKVTSSSFMFSRDTKLVGGAGTTYDGTKVDKTYARIDEGTSSPGYFTSAPEPSSFSSDSWSTIIFSVKKGNTSKYNVGDTKTVQIGNLGTFTLRIANITRTNSCDSSTYSETACGFVLEFEDVILAKEINNTASNVNGWPATELHYYLNNEFYSMIPTELKKGIIQTRVISGYGQSGSSNFTSTDYIYIPSLAEIYADATAASDTAKYVTRQLDYYSQKGVVTTNASATIKKLGNSTNAWWLRTPDRSSTSAYYGVDATGKTVVGTATLGNIGFSPAFRIG